MKSFNSVRSMNPENRSAGAVRSGLWNRLASNHGIAVPSLVLTLSFVFFAAPLRGAQSAEKPNLLLIIADDLNWRDLGCAGNPDVRTPNIDRLASEGMTLRGMFAPAPVCSPVRHALYTGIYSIRSGAYPNHTMVDPGTKSIFTHFKAMGYRVGLQAKTHVNPRDSFPFEYISKDADDSKAFAEFVGRDLSQPWLAVFASHDPHGPWNRGPNELYDPTKLKLPPWMHDNTETRRALAAYYAEVTQLDTQVGACLKAVGDTGQADNTLVLFVSDQGMETELKAKSRQPRAQKAAARQN